jgi:hypothetical protein
MITFVKSWSFVDDNNKTFNYSPVIEGLLTSLNALKCLSHELILDYGFEWFATRRCTQDHLEVS